MKLSLVVPCFNEEQSVIPFYKEAVSTFDALGYDYEIVFVNDGSRDGTLDMLKKLLDGPAAVKVVSFSRNFGKEAAMLAGLENAQGDYVSVIDADLQQHPSVVADMVKILDEEPDVDCVAAYQEKRDESGFMSLCKKSFYKIINRVSDTEFVDGASDFRTFRRQMVDEIVNMKEYFRFSKGIFSFVGFNTKYIPYTVGERVGGESKWNFTKLLRYALSGIISFTTSPLRIPLYLGILFIILSLPLFIVLLILHKGLTISAVYFVGGVILCSIGIIGEYLAKAYIQGKNRPVYIVKENLSNRK
ncbi:MAG: glycosyltransferase family 2 protein [Clostridia bacterium]|jgi:glycosyltransferase involved in cell wall biosynthesis|nr:glycosyltransferase family 2 protein [Clostridia bacterium]